MRRPAASLKSPTPYDRPQTPNGRKTPASTASSPTASEIMSAADGSVKFLGGLANKVIKEHGPLLPEKKYHSLDDMLSAEFAESLIIKAKTAVDATSIIELEKCIANTQSSLTTANMNSQYHRIKSGALMENAPAIPGLQSLALIVGQSLTVEFAAEMQIKRGGEITIQRRKDIPRLSIWKMIGRDWVYIRALDNCQAHVMDISEYAGCIIRFVIDSDKNCTKYSTLTITAR